MVKLASSLAILLLLGYAAPARAADCLQQIDGLTVEYDLPASESMAGTQTAHGAPATRPAAAPPDGTAAPLAPTARGGGGADFPKLPPRRRLAEGQRQRLEAKLHEARATEALGNEDQCVVLLKEAQAIAAEHR
jgi:hypothetical protein